MTFTLTGTFPATDKSRRYVAKILGSLEGYLPRGGREGAIATVRLDRVDRPHGNKYEAAVRLTVGSAVYEATDSTLNAYAALDIVRLKLARDVQAAARLPKA